VVITRWFASGTHRGTLMGIHATGRRGGPAGVTLTRFRGDRIVEDCALWDTPGLLRQLGAVA
jgi:predicted ester cyclase